MNYIGWTKRFLRGLAAILGLVYIGSYATASVANVLSKIGVAPAGVVLGVVLFAFVFIMLMIWLIEPESPKKSGGED